MFTRTPTSLNKKHGNQKVFSMKVIKPYYCTVLCPMDYYGKALTS